METYDSKKINETELFKKAEITTNAMAKLARNESVQVKVLAKICEVLNCDIEDVVKIER